MTVTAVDFAGSAHDVVHRDAVERGVADRITPVTTDVSSWQPDASTEFDLIVVAYLHSDLTVLSHAARWLAPGGQLVWIAHAPDSPHGPPPAVTRDNLTEHRHQLKSLDDDRWQVLRLEEYELNPEFLDILAVIKRSEK